MDIFGGAISVTGISFFIMCIFAILFAGYLLGRINIKGVSLGSAGVFVAALLFGALFYGSLEQGLVIGSEGASFGEKAFEIVETLGLILFVTSVGFIAGPGFFGNMKKNFKSYVLLGLIIILSGGITAVGCIFLGKAIGFGSSIDSIQGFVAMITGLFSGALTSTPAFSAAKSSVAPEFTDLVSVGYGIAYIFGVIGVVLFVQIIPRLTRANLEEERQKLVPAENAKGKEVCQGDFLTDGYGITFFALAAILGIILGKVKIPLSSQGLEGTCFSLTTTGGCLMTALVMGHIFKVGRLIIMPRMQTLKLFRELGLVLFLVGAGVPGGAEFVHHFDPMYFVYGIVMTVVPLVLGFLFAKYVLRMSLFNNLGSITGGMTSTPALGTLISTAGTENVAAAYAATYPIALIAVVIVSQLIVILFG